MAKTPSKMISLGTKAYDFDLFDVISEENKNLNEVKGDTGTLIMFICNHCPYVKHINKTIVKLANEFINDGIKFVAISSNDIVNYPEDSPELMKLNANENKYIFPYLFDDTQDIAKKYDAACTPDFFLYDKELNLVYRGQLDNSRPGNGIECDGSDLKYAITCILNNKQNERTQKPSIGCNIKWK